MREKKPVSLAKQLCHIEGGNEDILKQIKTEIASTGRTPKESFNKEENLTQKEEAGCKN